MPSASAGAAAAAGGAAASLLAGWRGVATAWLVACAGGY